MTENNEYIPNVVALEVLEKNGVNIERLKELVTKGVGAEFTTYYYYTILRMHCTGLDGEGIKEIVEDARIEDRNHLDKKIKDDLNFLLQNYMEIVRGSFV